MVDRWSLWGLVVMLVVMSIFGVAYMVNNYQ